MAYRQDEFTSHEPFYQLPPNRKCRTKKKRRHRRASGTGARDSDTNELEAGSSPALLDTDDEDTIPSSAQPRKSESSFLSRARH